MSRRRREPPAPQFQPSETRMGDRVVSRTFIDPTTGQIVQQYVPDPQEELRRKQAQERINQILPTLGQTAPEISNQYDQMMRDYIDQQTTEFNRAYDPTVRNLREDIGSRFGTLQATPFFDRLEAMEKNIRTPALLEIQRTGSQMRQGLFDQDQARKLRELQALNYNLSADQQSFLAGLGSSTQGSSLGNQFNMQRWQQELNQYNQAANRRNQMLSSMFGAVGSAALAF